MTPDKVTPQDIYAYMDARDAPVRANREKALLSHVFSYAIRWGVVADNPCRNVKRNTERPRKRYVTDAEFDAVYDMASPMIQCAMMISLLTGLRQGDILKLQIQSLTDEGIEVRTSKTGKAMLFEWTDELRDVVERAKKLRGRRQTMYLLFGSRGHRYTSSGFQTAWYRLMDTAVEEGAVKERFTFHDIRAKAGSDSEDDRLLGNDKRTLERHYKRKPVAVTPLRRKQNI